MKTKLLLLATLFVTQQVSAGIVDDDVCKSLNVRNDFLCSRKESGGLSDEQMREIAREEARQRARVQKEATCVLSESPSQKTYLMDLAADGYNEMFSLITIYPTKEAEAQNPGDITRTYLTFRVTKSGPLSFVYGSRDRLIVSESGARYILLDGGSRSTEVQAIPVPLVLGERSGGNRPPICKTLTLKTKHSLFHGTTYVEAQ